MDIGSYVAQNARKYPGKLAIECEGRRYTYRELNAEVNRLAHGFLAMGVEKGEKVALMMKNSNFFVFSFFAVAKIGAVAVPVNFRLTSPEVQYILQQSDSALVICDVEFEETVWHAQHGSGVRQVIVVGKPNVEESLSYSCVLSKNSSEPEVMVNEHDDLEILYTSGTTGKPKGALFDHARILKVGIAMAIEMGMGHGERFLHIAPLFHSAQLNLFLVPGMVFGSSHVIHRDFHPSKTLEAIQEHSVTHFFGVPAMYNFILEASDKGEHDLSSIKRCCYGAAPMAPELVRKSMEMFGTENFFNLCGLTEGGPGGVILDPEGHRQHPGKGGRAVFMTEARVVNPEGKNVLPGEVGEFIIRGETVMKGYYKKPEETARTMRGGWLHTGDLATVSDEGMITLVDRLKDMIISGGENVYSIEVEEVLYEHPAVLEAAIIGLPDEVWGEAVCAVVVPRAGAFADENELRAFCREKLAGYKVPRKVFIEKELPRNASGKILKYQLRQKLHVAER
ncbi:acyl-CoA synthetase [Mesobacillus zeae]|uniref:Long-chain-fatty-acid--CoA ligase n=1 Tax=Mesobacillus zeae TaxID=1917180 RepID=A0A398B3M8_9BACI|nr:long-chain fatty acid--CoA ligase [Mesobacillus zeae]RID84412.1 long-chain-fatty-acid--CoA ligase [Mesobacillus zeae]